MTFLAPPTRPDSLGRIGHYEVLQVLGRGAFGIVFRAFDDVLQRVVAVKVLAPPLAATSPARKRFLREAQSSAKTRHENVVQVYEVGEEPLPYLVMEFIPGETLQQRLDCIGPVDPDDDQAGTNERPQHEVTLTRPFYLGTHEVTFAQCRRFVEETTYTRGEGTLETCPTFYGMRSPNASR